MIYTIYKITNTINDKIYIGQHKGSMEKYWGSGLLIKRAIEKYGIENFTKDILLECDENEADDAEKYWIKQLNSTDINIGYNISLGGEGGDQISKHPRNAEIRKQISISNTGIKHTQEAKDKISATLNLNHYMVGKKLGSLERLKTFKGKTHKKETIEKIKESNKQNSPKSILPKKYKMNDEFREKCRNNNLGKPKSLEHRKHLSEALQGNMPSNSIITIVDGKEFIGMKEAARHLDIPYGTLRNRVKSKNIHFAGTYLKKRAKHIIDGRVIFDDEIE